MVLKLIVFSSLLASVLSASVPDTVPIVAQTSDIQPDGTYHFQYEAGDGTVQEQHGVPKPIDKDEVAEVVEGSVSYTDPEGGKHQLSYTADETGYHAAGSDLPVTPEIPSAILKSLDYIAAHPPLPEH